MKLSTKTYISTSVFWVFNLTINILTSILLLNTEKMDEYWGFYSLGVSCSINSAIVGSVICMCLHKDYLYHDVKTIIRFRIPAGTGILHHAFDPGNNMSALHESK